MLYRHDGELVNTLLVLLYLSSSTCEFVSLTADASLFSSSKRDKSLGDFVNTQT